MLQHGWTLKTVYENNKSQKPDIVGFYFYEMSRTDKSIETESRVVVVRPGRRQRMRSD